MVQQQNERHENAEPEVSIWTVIPIGFVIILMVAVLVGGILKSARFGPAIGDIVSFDAPAPALDQGPVIALRAGPTGSDHAGICTLRPEIMASGGGSLVIEQRENEGRGPFRVHWAGRRTAAGAEDCGSSAELVVNPNDLLALAASAGGFGVAHKRLLMSATGLAAPTALVE